MIRSFTVGAILFVTAASSVFAAQPNVVVFLVDDMGVMDTSVAFLTDENGEAKRYPLNDWYRTPNMERLAKQGVRFSTFYAQSVCSPTRVSIMTGQNAARHHTTNWINAENNNRGRFGPTKWRWTGLDEHDATLPGVLTAVGYRTIHVGKAHFGPNNAAGEFPDRLGFEVNIAGCAWGHPGSYYGEDGYGHIKGHKVRAVPHLEAYHGSKTFLTEALTIEANKQISRAVEDEKPFFLHMAHYAVHGPFHSDPRFAEHYADSDKSKPAQAYATLIEGMDKSLGDILDHLEDAGVAENTIVIFLGDNGGDAPLGNAHGHFSSAPLRGKKGTHYEGGVRVPFIAAWAKVNDDNAWQKKLPIARGVIQSQMGTVMDLYPTIVALTGAADPERHVIDGFDLKPLLAGRPDASRPQRFLMHFPHDVHRSNYFTSLRDGHWKVIYHYRPNMNPAKTRYELFNLADDPFENRNLAAENPAKLKQMMQAMVEQLNKEGAQYPLNNAGEEDRPIVP